MDIIGRTQEIKTLQYLEQSSKPEFVAVYGRRRIGKTYLIKAFFKERFAFYATGISTGRQRDKLRNFNDFLVKFGSSEETAPKDWFKAFDRLERLLDEDRLYRQPKSGKRVIFIDEAPWMDGRKSTFKPALDRFWNAYASTKEDILLIVCGSATSWIIKNFVKDKGGFYNRLTEKIHLAPFSLSVCAEYAKATGLRLGKKQIVELYMAFGGIPYYWSLLRKGESPAQSIDRLCFQQGGTLVDEFPLVFKSLFKSNGLHRRIVVALSKKNQGLLRTDLVKAKMPNSQGLTDALEELEQCGFVRSYRSPNKKERGTVFQLIDPFARFALTFLESKREDSWLSYRGSASYNSWSGIAFELVCLNNVASIKKALGVSGVSANVSAWRSRESNPGSQIDLLIERRDGITNLCEMKYTSSPFVIDTRYEKELANKMETYLRETKTKQALHLTMVSFSGLKENEHSSDISEVIIGDDLFD